MTKQELLKEIETQKSVVKALNEKLSDKEQQLKLQILNAFSDIIDVDKHIRISMNNDIWVTIELLNIEQKRIFGTDVEITVRRQFGEEEDRIFLNVGTCGSFTIKDEAQIKKYEIVTNFWKNYNKYSEVLLKAIEELRPYEKEFWNASSKLNSLKSQLEQIEREEETQAILSTINIGDKYEIKARWSFKRDWFKGNDSFVINKITDNSVLVEYHCTGYVTTENGRIKKSDFVYYIKNNYIIKENA